MGSSVSTTTPHHQVVAPPPAEGFPLMHVYPPTSPPSTLFETKPCEKMPVSATLTPPLLPESSVTLTPLSSTSDPPAHLDLSKFKAMSFGQKSTTPRGEPTARPQKGAAVATAILCDFSATPPTNPRLQKQRRRYEFTSVLSEEERKKNVEIKALRSLLPDPDLHSCPCFVKGSQRKVSTTSSGGSVTRGFQQQHHRRFSKKPNGRKSIVMLPPQSALDGDVSGSVSNTFKQRRRQRLSKRGAIDFVLPPSTRTSIATVNTTVSSGSSLLTCGDSSDDDEEDDGSSVLLSCGGASSGGEDGLSFSGAVGGEAAPRLSLSLPLLPGIHRRRF